MNKKLFNTTNPIIDTSKVGTKEVYNEKLKRYVTVEKTKPLVKDDKGKIIIAGTRYSRKRQHYPINDRL